MARQAEELLLIEESEAWFAYLQETRRQPDAVYQEVEPWAWAQLTQRLRSIKARRARMARALPAGA